MRATAVFAVAGASHAVANLLLARQLPVVEYAYIALFLAFLDFGAPLGTGGADTVVIRHKLTSTKALLRRVLAVASLVGVFVYFVASRLYDFSFLLALATAVAIVFGASNYVAAAIWQSMERFPLAVAQLQSTHVVLALLAALSIIFGWQTALTILLLYTLYLASISTIGWRKTRQARRDDPPTHTSYPWHECIPIIVITMGAQLAQQTERFLIPHLLRIEDLATYGVLAATVGSPFQMLAIAVGFTLLPRLKSVTSLAERARLLRREGVEMGIMALLGAIVVWLLAPMIVGLFVGDKFSLTTPLIFAAILIGLGKVVSSFPSAIVKALGTPSDLHFLSFGPWLGVVVSVLAAWPLSKWGLPGLLAGVSCGWAFRAALSMSVAAIVLRRGVI